MENVSLPAALEAIALHLHDSHRVLITQLDSSTHLPGLPTLGAAVADADGSSVTVGHGVATDLATFRRIVDKKFFTGFDEIWIYDGATIDPKPDSIRITSEEAVTEWPIERELTEWMKANSVLVGIGDGWGVNIVTFSADIMAAMTEVYGDALKIKSES